jgi:nitrate/nitrite transporter NarK
MTSIMVDRPASAVSPQTERAATGPGLTGPLVLATGSFTLSFAAWGLVGGLAPVFATLYSLSGSQTALLVAIPVLLGSLGRLPMGLLTDRHGGRLVFTALLSFSSLAAFVVPLTTSYPTLLAAAFLIGKAGSSFAVGAAFVSRWAPPARQGTAVTLKKLSKCLPRHRDRSARMMSPAHRIRPTTSAEPSRVHVMPRK